jgi:hypothetical protein
MAEQTTDIVIYPKGQEPIRLPQNQIRTFDLRLSGYTLKNFLDYTQPLDPPAYAVLKVEYEDGRRETFSFSRDGYAADHAPDDPAGGLLIRADNVQRLTG